MRLKKKIKNMYINAYTETQDNLYIGHWTKEITVTKGTESISKTIVKYEIVGNKIKYDTRKHT